MNSVERIRSRVELITHKTRGWAALIIQLLVIVSAMTVGSAHANSPFPRTTISSVIVHDGGSQVLVLLPEAVANSERCTRNDLLVLEKSHPLFNEMYAAILATYHANGAFHGWVNTCSERFGGPRLTRIDLVR